jgi:hypothetical protein
MSKRAPDEDDRYGPATHTCRYCAQVFDVIYETPTRLLVRLMSCKDAMSAFSSCKLIRQLLYPSVLERTSSVYVYLEINIKSHWPNWGFYGRHMEAGVLFTNVVGKIVQKKDIDRNFKSALGTFDLDDVLTDGFDLVNVHNSLWVYAYPSESIHTPSHRSRLIQEQANMVYLQMIHSQMIPYRLQTSIQILLMLSVAYVSG